MLHSLSRVLPCSYDSAWSSEHSYLWDQHIYLLHLCAQFSQEILPERTLECGLAWTIQVFRYRLQLQTVLQGAWELNLHWTNQRNTDCGGRDQLLVLGLDLVAWSFCQLLAVVWTGCRIVAIRNRSNPSSRLKGAVDLWLLSSLA